MVRKNTGKTSKSDSGGHAGDRMLIMRRLKERVRVSRGELEIAEAQLAEARGQVNTLKKRIAEDEALIVRAVDEPIQAFLFGSDELAVLS